MDGACGYTCDSFGHYVGGTPQFKVVDAAHADIYAICELFDKKYVMVSAASVGDAVVELQSVLKGKLSGALAGKGYHFVVNRSESNGGTWTYPANTSRLFVHLMLLGEFGVHRHSSIVDCPLYVETRADLSQPSGEYAEL